MQPFKSHFYVLVLGMFSFVIFVVLNAFVLSWVCPRFVLKSPHIPCTVFTMTFFSWNVFSFTFKGVKAGHLSWCLPHHVLSLCLGRAELLESATSPRPSFHILRAQKEHWSFCTMSFIFPNLLVNNLRISKNGVSNLDLDRAEVDIILINCYIGLCKTHQMALKNIPSQTIYDYV